MKILVMSDSHRNNDKIAECLEIEKPIDLLIHCGDAEGAEYFMQKKAECPVEVVMGNNDFFSALSQEAQFDIAGRKAFLTHGHYYYVSMGVERLLEEAQSRGVDFAFFGHTHRPYLKKHGDVLVMNPGSIAYPRQEGRKCSYGVIEVDENDKVFAEIRFLP